MGIGCNRLAWTTFDCGGRPASHMWRCNPKVARGLDRHGDLPVTHETASDALVTGRRRM
jgi:hypothetical protein